MINGYSIRKCAEEVKISIPTSFYWRHKILDAIRAIRAKIYWFNPIPLILTQN
jgi:transposase-like protein